MAAEAESGNSRLVLIAIDGSEQAENAFQCKLLLCVKCCNLLLFSFVQSGLGGRNLGYAAFGSMFSN